MWGTPMKRLVNWFRWQWFSFSIVLSKRLCPTMYHTGQAWAEAATAYEAQLRAHGIEPTRKR